MTSPQTLFNFNAATEWSKALLVAENKRLGQSCKSLFKAGFIWHLGSHERLQNSFSPNRVTGLTTGCAWISFVVFKFKAASLLFTNCHPPDLLLSLTLAHNKYKRIWSLGPLDTVSIALNRVIRFIKVESLLDFLPSSGKVWIGRMAWRRVKYQNGKGLSAKCSVLWSMNW